MNVTQFGMTWDVVLEVLIGPHRLVDRCWGTPWSPNRLRQTCNIYTRFQAPKPHHLIDLHKSAFSVSCWDWCWVDLSIDVQVAQSAFRQTVLTTPCGWLLCKFMCDAPHAPNYPRKLINLQFPFTICNATSRTSRSRTKHRVQLYPISQKKGRAYYIQIGEGDLGECFFPYCVCYLTLCE